MTAAGPDEDDRRLAALQDDAPAVRDDAFQFLLREGVTPAVKLRSAVGLGRRLPPDRSPFPGRRVNPWLLGAVLGLGYCAGELPNSFVKRRLGIPPGGSGRRLRWLQYLIDQTDSVAGCLVALRLVYRAGPADLALAAGMGAGAHIAVDRLMASIGLRRLPSP